MKRTYITNVMYDLINYLIYTKSIVLRIKWGSANGSRRLVLGMKRGVTTRKTKKVIYHVKTLERYKDIFLKGVNF